jgi:DNA repair exonuclease SbcCD ATPase subunit
LSACPGCGTELINPTKTWSMIGRPSKTGKRFKLTMGLFKCTRCDRGFRAVVGKERVTIKGIADEIKVIEMGLEQTLNDLRKKIKKLKNERTELLEEIENLKKTGEIKASSLEEEVASLRKEVEELKETLEDLE